MEWSKVEWSGVEWNEVRPELKWGKPHFDQMSSSEVELN